MKPIATSKKLVETISYQQSVKFRIGKTGNFSKARSLFFLSFKFIEIFIKNLFKNRK